VCSALFNSTKRCIFCSQCVSLLRMMPVINGNLISKGYYLTGSKSCVSFSAQLNVFLKYNYINLKVKSSNIRT
jgi:hypothetical protein